MALVRGFVRFPLLALALSLTAACGARRVAEEPALAPGCPSAPLEGASSFSLRDAAQLAGRYRLTLIQTGGTPTLSLERGELVLTPNDSSRRFGFARQIGRVRGERPLKGYLEVIGAPSYDERRSRDSLHPGVELIDSVLYLGGVDMLDGGGERLAIEVVASRGFWGHWRYDPGIEYMPDRPRGRYCALRM